MEIHNIQKLPSEYSIHPSLIGTTTALMIQPNMISGSRGQMQGTHYKQSPQIVAPEQRLLFTGAEFEYGKWMMNIVVEFDCYVDRVFERRARSTMDSPTILETHVYVRLAENPKMVSVIVIPRYTSNHQYFGYDYIFSDKTRRSLQPKKFLPKGTVLAECASVIGGEWCVGTHANAILVSDPNMIEDATKISDRLCDKMMAYGYKTFRKGCGEREYFLYAYGDEEHPRVLPDIGEKVRPDGLLMATRRWDPITAGLDMSARSLREYDGDFDDGIIVDKEAVVHDIKVYRDQNKVNRKPDSRFWFHKLMSTPVGQQEELDMFCEGRSHFLNQIRTYYKELKATSRRDLVLRPECGQVIREAISDNPYDFEATRDIGYRKLQFNNEIMDDYMVEITIKYPIPLDVSGKITDGAGGKGIIGTRAKLEEMPYDDYGNIVDIMMADNATLRRTNFNRPFELYINAARRDCLIDAKTKYDEEGHEAAWEFIMGFCDIVSPPWAEILRDEYSTVADQKELMNEWFTGVAPFRIWIPCNLQKDADIIEREVETHYPPRRSPITYMKPNGEWIRTEASFIVGPIYMVRLDKTGREMSAIATGRYQHFGTISKQHPADKYRYGVRQHPIKFMGESEARHLSYFIGGDVCADIHDKANNPVVADAVTRSILTAELPTNIVEVVNRHEYPLGHGRSMEMTQHVLSCEGVAFTTRRREDVRCSEFEQVPFKTRKRGK